MFETIGTILRAISSLVTSIVGITQSIDNVVSATNHATKSLDLTAQELEDDTRFTCKKKHADRITAMQAYEYELKTLAGVTSSDAS